MRLLDLFKEIKEENLSKQQLEDYHKELTEMYQSMHIQMGVLKKAKAIFMLGFDGLSVAEINRKWAGSTDGLREIELKSYIRATATTLSSLKSRLFSIY